MKENNENRHSLATERDIDPEFGLFEDNRVSQAVPDAEEELLSSYPEEKVRREASHDESGESIEDIPDADAISADSPVDPASPHDHFHGTDLLNGAGAEPGEEKFDRRFDTVRDTKEE
ncbi:hypothetical protein [Paenibacillus tarimensis]|uniref:hypothetical protein n=1 Tax=Paenibacillus tarimensis TaxID=416012 RepID=UPI001F2056E9|nr:hypothetical protein [Paenibacillus tarimensis]MCF2943707.1 hypothetical protein [Paenibacillus tarimensis]